MGSWGVTSVGASVGSLLVPGFRLLGSGAGAISSGGACAPPSACWGWSPVSPLDLLDPATPCVVSSSMSSQSWLSSVSPPVTSCCCCSGSASALLENVAVAMPLGRCDLLPCAVYLILIFCN